MTICNMTIEGGARAGLIAPDEKIFEYLKGKPMSPKDENWEKAVNYWQTLKTDTAFFDGGANVVSGDLIYLDYAAASSSNKLLIMSTLCISVQNGANNQIYGYLYIGGSVSAAIGDASSNRARVSLGGETNYGDNNTIINLTHNYLLSSPSTSSTTYSYRFHHDNTSSDRATYINRSHDDSDVTHRGRCTSTITIMEIAA